MPAIKSNNENNKCLRRIPKLLPLGKNLSDHTLRAYNIDLNEFSAFCTQTTTIADCDRHLLRNYLTYLFDKKNLKETSIKRRMACLKAMFHWLESGELLANNPFHKFKAPIKLPKRLPRGLAAHELRSLLTAPSAKLGIKTPGEVESITGNLSRKQFNHITCLLTVELLFYTGMPIGFNDAIQRPTPLEKNERANRPHALEFQEAPAQLGVLVHPRTAIPEKMLAKRQTLAKFFGRF